MSELLPSDELLSELQRLRAVACPSCGAKMSSGISLTDDEVSNDD